MRCSICLEEMDHPRPRVFSCPRKGEGWHTKKYRKVKWEYEMTHTDNEARRKELAERLELLRTES